MWILVRTCAVLSATVVFTSSVWAQPTTPLPLTRPESIANGNVTLALDLGVASTTLDASTKNTQVMGDLFFRARVAGPLVATVELGLSSTSTIVGSEDTYDGQLVLSNPFVGLHGVFGDSSLAFEVGLGTVIPTILHSPIPDEVTTFDDEADARDTWIYATSALFARAYHNQWNLWRWTANAWSLVVPARIAARFGQITVMGEAAVAWMVPLRSIALGDSSQVVFQVAANAGWDVGPVTLGLRSQLVVAASDNVIGSDQAQLAAGPWVAIRFGNVYAGAGLLVNLDEPLGFGFDRGRVWVASLQLGWNGTLTEHAPSERDPLERRHRGE